MVVILRKRNYKVEGGSGEIKKDINIILFKKYIII